MSKNPKTLWTKDYSKFIFHPENRGLWERTDLTDSMRADGFWEECPLLVDVPDKNGVHRIISGNNRFWAAKSLDIEFAYVVRRPERSSNPRGVVGVPEFRWSPTDYVQSRANGNDKDCLAVLEFARKHFLTTKQALSLLGGESAGSHNKVNDAIRGTFKVAKDLSHANAVVGVTDVCRSVGIEFATSGAFVSAVSAAVRVEGFDVETFKSRVAMYPRLMEKRGTKEEFLGQIEKLYNHRTRNKLNVAFLAMSVGRQRQATFGGKNKK